MSNNTRIQQPTEPGDLISTEDISGIKIPRSKMVLGVSGTDGGNVSSSNPMPVNVIDPITIGGPIDESEENGSAVRCKIVSGDDNETTSLNNPLPIFVAGPVDAPEGGGGPSLRCKLIINDNNDAVSDEHPIPITVTNGVEDMGEGGRSLRTKIVLGVRDGDEGNVCASNPLPVKIRVPVAQTTDDFREGTGDLTISYGSLDTESHAIGGIAWSFGDTQFEGGSITFESGSATVFKILVTSSGPGFIPFNPPLAAGSTFPLNVKLFSNNQSASTTLNVLGHWQSYY